MNDDAPAHPILFIDGICVLCNRFAKFVLRRDRNLVFRIGALQGKTAQDRVDQALIESLGTIVLIDEAGSHIKSTAVLRTVSRLGGIWPLAKIFFIIPRALRDGIYMFVARRRYRTFGKLDACPLPEPGEADRFVS